MELFYHKNGNLRRSRLLKYLRPDSGHKPLISYIKKLQRIQRVRKRGDNGYVHRKDRAQAIIDKHLIEYPNWNLKVLFNCEK
mgnify:CR=1 FL=1